METVLLFGFTAGAWVTIALIFTMFILMSRTKIPADMVFLGGMAVLLITGVLPEKEAVAGFSSPSVVSIGALFILVAGLVYTGVIQCIIRYVLGIPSTYPKAITRLMAPVALLSAFMTNTVVVALFLNVVKTWAKKLNITPSRLLIPLSYASGMGGICTLIGTPPNLIVSGMYAAESGDEMNVFITTIPGLFCLVVGILSTLALRRLIPERKATDGYSSDVCDFTAELVVAENSAAVGRRVGVGEAKQINNVSMLTLLRETPEGMRPLPQGDSICPGDRLICCGHLDEILDLGPAYGLVHSAPADNGKVGKLGTVAIQHGSPLIGQRMGSLNIEFPKDVRLVAVARNDHKLQERPLDIVLASGDTLLVETPKSPDKMEDRLEKIGLRVVDCDEIPNIGGMSIVSSLIVVGMLLLSAFKVLTLLQCSFLAALAMVLTRCCNIRQARESIDWHTLMIFAGSICLGTAIERTGIAHVLAEGILSTCGSSPLMALIAVSLVATFITEFISNTAAAAMLFPIAYQTALSMNANPVTFCICLMLAASSSFATPIGSPTHMLVYNVGGYRFTDFLSIGLLMNIIILAANIFIVTLLFPL